MRADTTDENLGGWKRSAWGSVVPGVRTECGIGVVRTCFSVLEKRTLTLSARRGRFKPDSRQDRGSRVPTKVFRYPLGSLRGADQTFHRDRDEQEHFEANVAREPGSNDVKESPIPTSVLRRVPPARENWQSSESYVALYLGCLLTCCLLVFNVSDLRSPILFTGTP